MAHGRVTTLFIGSLLTGVTLGYLYAVEAAALVPSRYSASALRRER
jgi:hypothetical protein